MYSFIEAVAVVFCIAETSMPGTTELMSRFGVKIKQDIGRGLNYIDEWKDLLDAARNGQSLTDEPEVTDENSIDEIRALRKRVEILEGIVKQLQTPVLGEKPMVEAAEPIIETVDPLPEVEPAAAVEDIAEPDVGVWLASPPSKPPTNPPAMVPAPEIFPDSTRPFAPPEGTAQWEDTENRRHNEPTTPVSGHRPGTRWRP